MAWDRHPCGVDVMINQLNDSLAQRSQPFGCFADALSGDSRHHGRPKLSFECAHGQVLQTSNAELAGYAGGPAFRSVY